MPIELQAKLLRILESGAYRPVGSKRTLQASARIVTATNRDLAELVGQGAFRQDLYYRILGVELRVPSLSERIEDIGLLAQHFLDELNAEHGTSKVMTQGIVTALTQRAWPGEVRQLRSEVTRLYHFSDQQIDDPDLVESSVPTSSLQPGSLRLEDAERVAILRALQSAGQCKDVAAKLLGISRGGLYSKLKRLGIQAS